MGDLEPITRNEKLWSGEDLTPVTRKEMYIKHLYDETQVIPEYPVTREEMFILKAGEELHDVTVEQLSVTENGTYSEEGVAYSPVIVNVPAPVLDELTVTENGTYTPPSGTDGYDEVTVDVPLPENAYLLKEIEDVEIASFNDGSDLPMPKLEVAIEPVQDLHGYDSPWVGGAGKNKLEVTATTQTINGVTFTVNSDGTVNLSGTATGTFVFPLISGTLSFSSDTIITGGYAEASASKVALRINGSNLVPSEGYTISANTNITEIAIRVNSGFNTNGVKLYPMIRLATVSDATFAPYSNICPIIGWDECKVTRCGKNLSKSQTNNSVLCSVKKGVTYTVSFDGNVGANIKKNTNSGEVVIWGPQLPLTFTADEDFNLFLNAWNANISNIQVEVGNQATAYEPYNGQTITLDLDGTRYGGKVDLVSGVMTVEKVGIKGVNVARVGQTGSGVRYADTTNIYADLVQNTTTISDRYVQINTSQSGKSGEFRTYNGEFTIYDDRFTDITTAQSLLNDVEFCYELATPLTIQLTPTVVKSLRGMNNVFADTGNILDLSYLAKEE